MFPKYKSQCPPGGADRKASHLAFTLGGGGVPPTHLCPPGHPAGTSHPSQGISLIACPSMSLGGGGVSPLLCQPESVSAAALMDHTQGRLKTHVSSGDVGVAGYSSAHMVASDPAMGPGAPRGPDRALGFRGGSGRALGPRQLPHQPHRCFPLGGEAGPGPDQQRGLLWERRLHALDLGQPAFWRSG